MRAFFRCPSGHYFHGPVCPIDGWTSNDVEMFVRAVGDLTNEGSPVDFDRLSAAGLPPSVLAKVMLAEFGDVASTFDAIAPEGYVIDGKWWHMSELGSEFK